MSCFSIGVIHRFTFSCSVPIYGGAFLKHRLVMNAWEVRGSKSRQEIALPVRAGTLIPAVSMSTEGATHTLLHSIQLTTRTFSPADLRQPLARRGDHYGTFNNRVSFTWRIVMELNMPYKIFHLVICSQYQHVPPSRHPSAGRHRFRELFYNRSQLTDFRRANLIQLA